MDIVEARQGPANEARPAGPQARRDIFWTDTLTALSQPSLDPLFWRAERLGSPSAWWQHVPFAHWIVCATAPRILVELGTHTGVSYAAFCQAVERAGLATRCHAVDTWCGDPHAGMYGPEILDELRAFHNERFGAFSTLLQCTFDEALDHIDDGSIDLLHIDGLHTYDAVRHDFESWLPKLSGRAVVMFHDINVRTGDFGVWRLWAELRQQYPGFEFVHGHGLGVLAVGADVPPPVTALCELTDPDAVAMIRTRFARLGEHWWMHTRERMLGQELARSTAAANSAAEQLRAESVQQRAAAEQLRAEVAQQHAEAEQLRAELVQQRAAAEQLRAEVAQQHAEAEQLRAEVVQQRAEAEQLRTELVQQRAEAEQLRTELVQQRAGTEQLRVELGHEADALRKAAEHAWEDFRAASAKASELEQATADLRTRAEQAEARAQLAEIEGSAVATRAAELDRALIQAWAERDGLLESTVWRATWPVRVAGRYLPPGMRRAVRGGAKFGWWTVTMKLPGKLRERREALRRGRLPADDERDGSSAMERLAPETDTDPFVEMAGDVCPEAELSDVAEDPYQRWVREYDSLSDADRHAIQLHIASLPQRPIISVLMPAYNTDEGLLRQAISSVCSQLYPYWELCVADDASSSPQVASVLAEAAAADARIRWVRREKNGHIAEATNTALGLATGPFVALMDHDDLLAEHALYEVAVVLNVHPDADLIYTDEDRIDQGGLRHSPYFKTDWNYDLLLGHNLICHLGVYRRSLVEGLGGVRVGLEGSQDYDLALRVAAVTSPDRIHHIPAVLYHWRMGGSSFSELYLDKCTNAARRAIADHLRSIGGQAAEAEVLPHPTIPEWNRIIWQLPASPPRVSIIVPTRDRSDLLAQCASGVLHRTDYSDIELIIIDNDSVEPETDVLLRGLARDPRVRVLPFAGLFNYSAINNFAVRQATGDVVVLLNNDTVVTGGDWLREMVSHVIRPEVGAVGAKLLHADDTVQHAGVVLGIGSFDGGPGVAGHFGYGQPCDDPGYFGQNALTRELSACTGACLALRRDIYLGVGGLDEEHLSIAFNDVDLCIRLRKSGYKVIWTPFAELYHLESASRGSDSAPVNAPRFRREVEYMRARWGSVLDNDPFYNPNFSRVDALFSLAFPPFREKPWRNPVPLLPASAPAPLQSRSEMLLAPIPRDGKILEIGPSFAPIAPKSDGWNTKIMDHATRDGLVAKYTSHRDVNIGRIEEVDFIWSGGKLCNAVPIDERGTFDACIASHVIEHTPDLISFLNSMEVLLRENGVVALAIPDKRYCFDYFRPLTTTGQILYAHIEARSRHAPPLAFDFAAYSVDNGGSIAWGQHPAKGLRFLHSLERARGLSRQVQDSEDYVDVHAWCFVPASFELILFELAMLGETDLRVERTTPAQGCEFLCWLRRGGKAVVAAMSEAEKADMRLALLKRAMLETRAQVDWLLAGEPDLAKVSGPAALTETDMPLRPVATAPSPQPTAPADKVDSKSNAATDVPVRATAHFVDWMPAVANAARIFDGDWSSDVPGLPGTGQALLFDDNRILWFERHLGGYQGKRVLELGPLEGGHTHMMTSRGAEVLAIESNTKAWMRCLVVKNHLDMRNATFLLGDFQQYLNSDPPPPRFDFVLASGVLYHMTDPVRLLLGIARTTYAIGLWTHYFDKDVLGAKQDVPGKFSFEPRHITTPRGRPVRYYDQAYLQALDWAGFCGGSAPGSVWMARDEILDVLGDEGFACETGIEDIDHPNGPAFCIFAQRR